MFWKDVLLAWATMIAHLMLKQIHNKYGMTVMWRCRERLLLLILGGTMLVSDVLEISKTKMLFYFLSCNDIILKYMVKCNFLDYLDYPPILGVSNIDWSIESWVSTQSCSDGALKPVIVVTLWQHRGDIFTLVLSFEKGTALLHWHKSMHMWTNKNPYIPKLCRNHHGLSQRSPTYVWFICNCG